MTDSTMAKMIVTLNHDDAHSVMASLVMAASIAGCGDEVYFFVQPGAGKVLVKGELEKYQGLKGEPDPVQLFDAIQQLDGHFVLCELGLEVCDIKPEDLRDGVDVMMASSFLFRTEGAKLNFSY